MEKNLILCSLLMLVVATAPVFAEDAESDSGMQAKLHSSQEEIVRLQEQLKLMQEKQQSQGGNDQLEKQLAEAREQARAAAAEAEEAKRAKEQIESELAQRA